MKAAGPVTSPGACRTSDQQDTGHGADTTPGASPRGPGGLGEEPPACASRYEKPAGIRAKTPWGTLLLLGTVCVLLRYCSGSLPQPPAGIPSSCRALFGDSPVSRLAPRAPWWPLGAAEARGSWRGCSKARQSSETVTPKTHNPAGEHGARS